MAMLTERQARLVKDTWEVVVGPCVDKHAMVFFMGFISRVPEVKTLLLFLYDLCPKQGARPSDLLELHATKALKAIGSSAASFEGPDAIAMTLVKIRVLGRLHSRHNVKEEHFPIMKAAFMDTLRKALRSLWRTDIETAWNIAIDMMTGEMIEGLREGYAKQNAADD